MKKSNVSRRVDDLGRIVLPIDMRKQLGLNCGDPVFIQCENNRIIIRRAVLSCDFCGSTENVSEFGDGAICGECADKLFELRGRDNAR